MRDLTEIDDVPTKIVRVIGEMGGILIYTAIGCCTPCCIKESQAGSPR